MQAGQSLSSFIGEAVGRPKFDVTLVWIGGDRRVFADATVHHMDGWLIVSQYTHPDWAPSNIFGFRGDEVKSYEVIRRE